jgi:hypothetical protein
MLATPEVSPNTATGTLLALEVEPLPSWPLLLLPQHHAPPEVVTTQAWLPPVEMLATPEVCPDTSTGTPLFVVELLPSSPIQLLRPQHFAPPDVVTAQVELLPAEILATPAASPDTATGTLLFVVELLPSSP